MDKNIDISIIIPAFRSEKTIVSCLQSIFMQKTSVHYEVIVVNSFADQTPTIIQTQFPQVQLLQCDNRKSPGAARNLGIKQAKGQILVFLDSDCVASAGWLEEISNRHSKHDVTMIGGVIANGNPQNYIGWGHYFAEFSHWMPSKKKEIQKLIEVPGSSISIKRKFLDHYDLFPEGIYCEDTLFNWQIIAKEGKPLVFSSICIYHTNCTQILKLLKKQLIHGWHFAVLRLEHGMSNYHRVLIIALGFLLPAIIFFRITKNVFSKQIYIQQFLLTFPLVLLMVSIWSLGEILGYIYPKRPQLP